MTFVFFFFIRKHDIKSMTRSFVSFKKDLTLLKQTLKKRDLMWGRERSEEKVILRPIWPVTSLNLEERALLSPSWLAISRFSTTRRPNLPLELPPWKRSGVPPKSTVSSFFVEKKRLRNNQDRELACLESFVTVHNPSCIIKFKPVRSPTTLSKYIILQILISYN